MRTTEDEWEQKWMKKIKEKYLKKIKEYENRCKGERQIIEENKRRIYRVTEDERE